MWCPMVNIFFFDLWDKVKIYDIKDMETLFGNTEKKFVFTMGKITK